jgi:hypothetical protein
MAERRHKWNSTSKKSRTIKAVFTDDQVIVPNTVDIATYKINQIIIENGLNVFAVQKFFFDI